MSSSFSIVAVVLVVAYLAPIVFVSALIFLGLPALSPLGVHVLRGGTAGAAAGALVSLLIGLLQHNGANGRGILIAAAFGFAAAGIAAGLMRARRRRSE